MGSPWSGRPLTTSYERNIISSRGLEAADATSMSDMPLVLVEGVSKKFCRNLKKSLWYGAKDMFADVAGRSSFDSLRSDEFWAVEDISFELKRGQCLGLLGANGAGKTTLLKMLNGLVKPDRGRIEIRGRVGALISLGAGFNPVLSGRENIFVNGAVLGLSKQDIKGKLDEIIEFAEIGEFIDSPVQNYSSGMIVRLGFAIATTLEADVLLLDEVLAVGDANFRAKCFQRLGQMLEQTAVVLVSHYPSHIRRICDEVILIERGRLVGRGEPEELLKCYQTRSRVIESEPLELLSSEVSTVSVETLHRAASTGGMLSFELSVDSNADWECGLATLNILDGTDDVLAQAHLRELERRFSTGTTRHRIEIGPLHLAEGRYSFSLILYGARGKSTAVHLRRCLTFDFEGPPWLGPDYYPPSRAHLVS